MGKLPLSDTSHIRLLEESDAAQLHALIVANRAHLARWLPWAAGQTFEDTHGFICRTREQLTDNDGFQVAIVLEKSIVGVIGYVSVDSGKRSTRVGYWLDERLGFRQRGDAATVPTGRRPLPRLRQLLDAGGRLTVKE